MVKDMKLRILIDANIAQCYINLGMFDDSLEVCNKALEIDCNNGALLYRKAISLAYLLDFLQSSLIYENTFYEREIEEIIS